MAATETVLCDVDGPVATITFNRPDRHNAIGDDMADRLLAALERVASDDDVAVLILTGAGRSFCPGADVANLAARPDGPDRGAAAPVPTATQVTMSRRWMHTSELLREMPKVTIAAVNGACAGAGLSWALACDLRLAARSAVFRTAFVAVGASGDYGVNWTLPRLVGWSKARELLFLNEKVSPDEALRIGLVAKVFDDEQLLLEARAMAADLAARPRAGLLAMKQNLLDAEALSFGDEITREAERIGQALSSPEARAAARAFVDRPRSG